jgi:hypothetical protein
MKLVRNILAGLGILTTVLLSNQPAKAEWINGQYYPQSQTCTWVLNGYDPYGNALYRQVCSYSQSDYSVPYTVDNWYPNNHYNNRYNQNGFSIQFGTGGYNNFPFIFNSGGSYGHGIHHRHH